MYVLSSLERNVYFVHVSLIMFAHFQAFAQEP